MQHLFLNCTVLVLLEIIFTSLWSPVITSMSSLPTELPPPPPLQSSELNFAAVLSYIYWLLEHHYKKKKELFFLPTWAHTSMHWTLQQGNMLFRHLESAGPHYFQNRHLQKLMHLSISRPLECQSNHTSEVVASIHWLQGQRWVLCWKSYWALEYLLM